MEIEVKINVSAKEVFGELVKSVQHDIKNSTGKKISVEKLYENYSYKKRLVGFSGEDIEVSVNIDKLVYPSNYSAKITNPKGVNIIEYIIQDNDDGSTIKYLERYESKSIFSRLNNMLVSFLFSKSSKKKIIKNFNVLEQQILDKRNRI